MLVSCWLERVKVPTFLIPPSSDQVVSTVCVRRLQNGFSRQGKLASPTIKQDVLSTTLLFN